MAPINSLIGMEEMKNIRPERFIFLPVKVDRRHRQPTRPPA